MRVVALLIVFGLTASAFAQTSRPDEPPPSGVGETTGETGSVLAGPGVREPQTPASGFGTERNRRRQIVVPTQQWIRVLNGVDLDETQRAEVQAIVDELTRAQREYNRVYGVRTRELQQEIRTARQQDRRIGEERLAELADLRGRAPRAEEAQLRIWSLLDDDQQATLRTRLDEIRRQIVARRSRDRVQTDADEGMESMESGEGMQATDDGDGRRRGRRSRLSPLGRRRLNFLRSRQSVTIPGRGPTEGERQFEFDD